MGSDTHYLGCSLQHAVLHFIVQPKFKHKAVQVVVHYFVFFFFFFPSTLGLTSTKENPKCPYLSLTHEAEKEKKKEKGKEMTGGT